MRFNVQTSRAHKDKSEMKSDALLTTLRGMTPTQAAAWVDTNVTNLASAKTVLKVFAKVIVILAREID